MISPTKFVWMNGKRVEWDKAQVHFLTHSLHYGSAIFEGIRANHTPHGPAIFRLSDHLKRFYNSAKIMRMKIPFEFETIFQACTDLVAHNGLKSCYIRPLAFYGYGVMGVGTLDAPVSLGIAAWPWGSYLGVEGEKKGIRVKVSSFASHDVNIVMTKSKTTGNYATFGLAKNEAVLAGFDEAIMLDPDGYVSEGSAENIFIVRDGYLMTPPKGNVLEGITRDSILALAHDLKIPVKEERFSRDMLYTADEAFLCGTAAEVTPIVDVDDRVIGQGHPGPMTHKLQKKFLDIIHGRDKKYFKWLTFVKMKP